MVTYTTVLITFLKMCKKQRHPSPHFFSKCFTIIISSIYFYRICKKDRDKTMRILIYQSVSSSSCCPQADQILPKVPVPQKMLSRSGLNNILKKNLLLPNSKLSGLEDSSRKARISLYTAVRTPFPQCVSITKTNHLMTAQRNKRCSENHTARTTYELCGKTAVFKRDGRQCIH